MTTPHDFSKFMVRLGMAIPRFAPNTGDRNVLEVWYEQLGELTNEQLQTAFSKAVATCESFPSMKQIREFVGKAVASDEDKARDIAERIYLGLGKIGLLYANDDRKLARLKEHLGEAGMEVVRQMGGWNVLCEITDDDNVGMLKAQWREFAAVVLRKTRSGETGPPKFDLPPGKTLDMLKLAASNSPSLSREERDPILERENAIHL
jgi:hypothetical protein